MLTQGSGILPNDGNTVVPLYPNGSDGESESTVEETEAEDQETQAQEQQESTDGTIEQTELNNLEAVQSELNGLYPN